MAIQTEYGNMAPGVAGGLANQEPRVLISRNCEVEVPFGAAVMQGTEDKGCILSSGSGFLGIAVEDKSTPGGSYAQYRSARIATKGVVWVIPAVAVAAGEAATALANGQLSNTGGHTIPGARWDTSAEAGELAQLRLA